MGLKRQRRHVLFPKRSCTIAKDRQSELNHPGWDPGCIEICSAVIVLGLVCCLLGEVAVVGSGQN